MDIILKTFNNTLFEIIYRYIEARLPACSSIDKE